MNDGKFCISYKHRKDLHLLKQQMQIAIQDVKMTVQKDFSAKKQDPDFKKFKDELQRRMLSFILNVTNKFQNLMDVKSDKEINQKKKLKMNQDQTLIKQNQVNILKLKRAYKIYKEFKPDLNLDLQIETPKSLKIQTSDKEADFKVFAQQYCALIQKKQIEKIKQLENIEQYILQKSKQLPNQYMTIGADFKGLPQGEWEFMN